MLREKQGILAALAATGGNKAQAAAILEIDRSTLDKKAQGLRHRGLSHYCAQRAAGNYKSSTTS